MKSLTLAEVKVKCYQMEYDMMKFILSLDPSSERLINRASEALQKLILAKAEFYNSIDVQVSSLNEN